MSRLARPMFPFEVIHGAKHGGKEFFDAERMTLVRSFVGESLR